MEPNALFLDLDGTLLNDRREVTPENRRAVREAVARGHKVVITSGRPLESVLRQVRRLGLDDCCCAAYNGAILYDGAQQKILSRRTLDPDTLYAIFDEARRRGVYIQTYDGETVAVEPDADVSITRRYCQGTEMPFRVVESVRDLAQPPCKALVIDFAGRALTDPMRVWINETFPGRAQSFFSSPYYLEVAPAGTGKDQVVREVCALLGIPVSRAVAAGDEANDVPMLRAAGVGAAMRNGVEAARAAADYVTERDNNHDGVAEIIDRFLLDRESPVSE